MRGPAGGTPAGSTSDQQPGCTAREKTGGAGRHGGQNESHQCKAWPDAFPRLVARDQLGRQVRRRPRNDETDGSEGEQESCRCPPQQGIWAGSRLIARG